jgi:Ca2+-binding RTX toxin-like protein
MFYDIKFSAAATLAFAALSFGCGPGVPGLEGDRVFCSCECTDTCDVYELTSDGIPTGRCFLPNTRPGYDVEGDRCVLAGETSPTAVQSACQLGCQELNTRFTYNLNGIDFVNTNPLAVGRQCTAVVFEGDTTSETKRSPNSCEVPEGSTTSPLISEQGGRQRARIDVLGSSSAVLRLGETTRTLAPADTDLEISGGNCPGRTCAITVPRLRFALQPFSLGYDSIEDVVVDNEDVLRGTKRADGTITFESGLQFISVGKRNGYVSASRFTASADQLGGSYDAKTGKLKLTAALRQVVGGQTQSLDIVLDGVAVERPPIANAGPDQTLNCNGSLARLNGSSSFDPDGSIVRYVWMERNRVLATTAQADVALATAGAHDITLTVFDDSGRHGTDVVRVSVQAVGTVSFTSVPPAIVVTDCATTPNIGMPTARSSCGSPVTITNNAPARFAPGRTTVTWTARDAAGHTVTATQVVTVLLGDNPVCCPANTNVIVGTSNNDTITGTSGADCILGRGGQDTLSGGGGNDFVSGGDGDDTVSGGIGDDRLFGGSGQDVLSGGDGADVLSCGDGDDRGNGDGGNDTVSGGQGQDQLNGGDGNDNLEGNDGDDVLNGAAGDDRLEGGGLHDRCIGGSGTNTFLTCEVRE